MYEEEPTRQLPVKSPVKSGFPGLRLCLEFGLVFMGLFTFLIKNVTIQLFSFVEDIS